MTVLVVALTATQMSGRPDEWPKLLNEGARASFTADVLELRGSSGWLRTPQPVLDFDVSFEIRALTPDAEPGLIVRTWRGWQLWPEKGYRLTIPAVKPIAPSALLNARGHQAKVLREGTVDLRSQGEWQKVRVVAQRGRVVMMMNDVLAGDFLIENQGGYLMFDNRKGRVELRQLALRTSELNEALPTDIQTEEELKKLGGTPPQVLYELKPTYTPEALRAGVTGIVKMEAVVGTDGSVGPIRITRKKDPDLDVAAVAALRSWRFRPALLNGSPVPVVVEILMRFTIQ